MSWQVIKDELDYRLWALGGFFKPDPFHGRLFWIRESLWFKKP